MQHKFILESQSTNSDYLSVITRMISDKRHKSKVKMSLDTWEMVVNGEKRNTSFFSTGKLLMGPTGKGNN